MYECFYNFQIGVWIFFLVTIRNNKQTKIDFKNIDLFLRRSLETADSEVFASIYFNWSF